MNVSTQRQPTHDQPIRREELDAHLVRLLGRLVDHPEERENIHREVADRLLPVARSIASRYYRKGIDHDDLDQVACLGLTKAMAGYRHAPDASFLAYAVPTMRGEIRRHFRDAGWTVRPPRSLQELKARITAASEELSQREGRPPTLRQISEHLGVPLDDVAEAAALDSCFAPTSLDVSLTPDGDGSVLHETIGAEDAGYSFVESRADLSLLCASLSPRDKEILDLRFGQGLRQVDIGERLGISQVQVSRLLSRIMADLRRALDTELDPGLEAGAVA